jgi:hypothetical protein
MITPENNIPLDDQQNSEAEDQQSQKDIHSNGLENTGTTPEVGEEEADTGMLNQAYDAAEPSFTLKTDNEKCPESGV